MRPVALLHLARSVIPRGWSWYHPTGIGTTSASYAEIAQTITTLAPATSTTLDVVARTSGSGSVRVTITDGTNSDNVVLASSGSEATRTGTLDVSSFIAGAPCVVTLDALARLGNRDRLRRLAHAAAAHRLGYSVRLADLLDGSVPERGDRGPVVTALQENLRADGFDVGVDGIFGVQTARTVRLWQFLHFGRDPGVGECDLAVSLVLFEEAEPSGDDVHDVARLVARLPVPLLERGDLLHVWSALRLMRAEHRRIGFDDFDEARRVGRGVPARARHRGDLAESRAVGRRHRRARRRRSRRRGAVVRSLRCRAGTSPRGSRAPDGEPGRAYLRTGSAARTWLDTPARDRLLRGSVLGRLVDRRRLRPFVRTSAPESHRDTVLAGEVMKGHTGIVVDLEGDGFVAVAGNSSGAGHSGSGSVAVEVIAPTRGHALRAWSRLVGIACTSEKL